MERRGGGAALSRQCRAAGGPARALEIDARTLADADLPEDLSHPDRVILGGGGQDRGELLRFVLAQLKPNGVVVIPLATIEAVGECRPEETAGLTVALTQLQAWRGAPLAVAQTHPHESHNDPHRSCPVTPRFRRAI